MKLSVCLKCKPFNCVEDKQETERERETDKDRERKRDRKRQRERRLIVLDIIKQ